MDHITHTISPESIGHDRTGSMAAGSVYRFTGGGVASIWLKVTAIWNRSSRSIEPSTLDCVFGDSSESRLPRSVILSNQFHWFKRQIVAFFEFIRLVRKRYAGRLFSFIRRVTIFCIHDFPGATSDASLNLAKRTSYIYFRLYAG